MSAAATAAAGEAIVRRRRRRFVAGSRTAGHQSHAHRPRGQPAWGRRGVRSSSAIRKILSLSIRHAWQHDAPTSSASRDTVASARSVAATPSRCRATISSGGGALPPASSKSAAAWRRRIRATSSQRLARRAARTALSAASRYRSREDRTAAIESGATAARRRSSAGAPATRARWSQWRRSRVHACRSISSWRSASKISTASSVR